MCTGVALIWVGILGLIVLFIYGVVSFAFLSESFLAENNSDGDLFCTTLYECFVSTIRYGLIDNLGLVGHTHICSSHTLTPSHLLDCAPSADSV